MRGGVRRGVHPAARRRLRGAGVLLLRDRAGAGAQGPGPGGREARRPVRHRPLEVGAGPAEAGRRGERPVPPPRPLLRHPRHPRRAPVLRRGGGERAGRPAGRRQVRRLRGRVPGRARPGPHRPAPLPGAEGVVRGARHPAGRRGPGGRLLRAAVRAVRPGPAAGVPHPAGGQPPAEGGRHAARPKRVHLAQAAAGEAVRGRRRGTGYGPRVTPAPQGHTRPGSRTAARRPRRRHPGRSPRRRRGSRGRRTGSRGQRGARVRRG